MKIFLCIVSLFVSSFSHSHDGYYWREYYGTDIPDDAFIAGRNYNGQNVYIGQGTYVGSGLIPGNIVPGVLEVPVNSFHVTQMSKFNKILCGRQENFYWMRANSTHLHVQVVGKIAVIGGHNFNQRTNIGRIAEGGKIHIGKIDSFVIGGAPFYFNDNSKRTVYSYEILMYNSTV